MDAINTNTLGASRKARELCARALELDPEYAMAWVMQGHCHHQLADESKRHGYVETQEKELSLAMECGHKALALDPTLADAYALLSICHLTDFDFERALETSREALNLAPHNAENLGMAAIIHIKAGLPERGLELIKMAMRYCPVYPRWFLWSMGMSYRAMDRLEEAISIFETAVSQGFEYLSIHVSLASAYGEAGQLDKAKATAAEVLRQNPKFSISRYMSGLAYRNPRDRERVEHGLRKAGLPE